MDTSLNQSSSPPSQSSQEWTANFKSTLNRLSTQYLLLLRAASSEVALEEDSNDEVGDGGGGGGANGKNGSDPRGKKDGVIDIDIDEAIGKISR
jgi:hypothetical protein